MRSMKRTAWMAAAMALLVACGGGDNGSGGGGGAGPGGGGGSGGGGGGGGGGSSCPAFGPRDIPESQSAPRDASRLAARDALMHPTAPGSGTTHSSFDS